MEKRSKLDEILTNDLPFNKKVDIGETLYFDETNNIRKGIIGFEKDNVENLENLFFVLGGISTNKRINFNDLCNFVGIDENIEEVKFKTFLKGKKDFLNILKSEKLEKLFLFLLNNGIHIHFHTLHYLHFALVDILDSLIEENDVNQYAAFLYYKQLQSDMHEVLFADHQRAHDFLCEYEFPNVPQNRCNDFIYDLYQIYTDNLLMFDNDNPGNFTKELLRQIIKAKLDKNNLIFLSGNKPRIICDGVQNDYVIRVSEFTNFKYLDFEITVKKYLEQMDNEYRTKLNIDFLDSKNSREIQISDVICGFVSKLYTFLISNSEIEILKKLNNLDFNSTSFKTLNYFLELMDRSNNISQIMFKKTNPLFVDKRFDFVVYFINHIESKNKI